MSWTVTRRFTDETGKIHRPGETITDADAKKMGLAGKPELARKPKTADTE